MTGQPGGTLTGQKFDVDRIDVTEPGGEPYTIIDQGDTFTLAAHFKGDGSIFQNMCNNKLEYQVVYSINNMTGPSPEQRIGIVKGKLVPGQKEYGSPATRLTIANGAVDGQAIPEGVYEVIAVVQFPTWSGFVGYTEQIIQINPLSELA
jgi:hypothetical protein